MKEIINWIAPKSKAQTHIFIGITIFSYVVLIKYIFLYIN